MKKVYLAAASLLVGAVAFGQNNPNSTIEEAIPVQHTAAHTAKTGNLTPIQTPDASNRATHYTEDFESGVFPPAGWTVVSGPSSTVTVPVQEWHEEATGNPGNCASVLYDNSNDVHDEWLITDAISIPNTGGGIRLEFDINTSQFWHVDPNDNGDIVCYITTGGNTISDFALNSDTIFWEQDPNIVNEWQTYVWWSYQVDLTAYAGQTVYFGWHYAGLDAAQFNLDNISIYDIDADDLMTTNAYLAEIDNDYVYGIYNDEQLRPIGITATIKNNGSATQTNVGFNYEIVDGSGTVVDNGQSTAAIPSLAAGVSEDIQFNTAFTPPTGVENYTVNVWPFADNADMNMTNDTIVETFDVSEFVWARENGPMDAGITNISGGTGQTFKIGNTFLATGDQDCWAVNVGIGANCPTGQIVFAEIYEYNGTDYSYIGTTVEHTVTAADVGNIIYLVWDNSQAVPITAGQDLLVVGGHYGGDPSGSDDIEFGTSGNGVEGTVLGYDSGNGLFQLTDPSVPMIRINSDPALLGLEDQEATFAILSQNQPNPFDAETVIAYELQNSANVSIEVYDITGKQVYTATEGTQVAGPHQIRIDGNNLAAGAYHYTLIVDGERLTRKMIKSK